jgi:membrane-associated phospholipid phosphatase
VSEPITEPITEHVAGFVPGRSQFGPLVDTFDAKVDHVLEHLRGHPYADRLFLGASHAGDWSAIWHVLSLTRGLVRGRPDQVVALALAIGAESLIVNQGVKRVFRRERPTTEGDDRYAVRRPSTSAFPSGHASAAAFAATAFVAWDGRRWATWWVTVATVVGVSRAYVRIHHASDVLGGALVGYVLARLARPVLRRFR